MKLGLGLKPSGITVTLTEASNLIDEIYKIRLNGKRNYLLSLKMQ